jgi:cytochrome P450
VALTATRIEDSDLRSPDEFDALDPSTVGEPYPYYAALREQAPVYKIPETDVYFVSKRNLIEEVLERHNYFSANLTGVLMTGADGKPEVFDLLALGAAVDAIANADEPFHAVHRKLVMPGLTPTAVNAMEPVLRDWAVAHLEPLIAEGRGDWVRSVANPIPARAIASVVGLPIEDADRLLDWAMAGTEILAGTTTHERMAQVAVQSGEMAVYLDEHLQRAIAAPVATSLYTSLAAPSPGVLGELARGVHQGLVSESDAVGILIVLVGAGGESTSSLVGNAVRMLAERPDLQAELRANPVLIDDFIEEALRLESPFRGHYRAVKRDVTLGGIELPEGSHLLLLWAAANRDPENFEDPNSINIRRVRQREHLAFGRGTHFCVGARLARLEARIVLEELLARTSDFSLNPQRQPTYVPSIFVRRHSEIELIVEGRSG